MMPDSTVIVVQVEAGVTDIFQRQARRKQKASEKDTRGKPKSKNELDGNWMQESRRSEWD